MTVKQKQRGEDQKTCTLFYFAPLSSYHEGEMWKAPLSCATVDVLFWSNNAFVHITDFQSSALKL